MSCDPFEWTCARCGKTYSTPFFMSYPREFWKGNKKRVGEVCEQCRDDHRYDVVPDDVDIEKDEEWRNYLDDDEKDMPPEEDEISFSQLADEEKGDELFRDDDEEEEDEPEVEDEPDDFDVEIDERDFEEDDDEDEKDDEDDDEDEE